MFSPDPALVVSSQCNHKLMGLVEIVAVHHRVMYAEFETDDRDHAGLDEKELIRKWLRHGISARTIRIRP